MKNSGSLTSKITLLAGVAVFAAGLGFFAAGLMPDSDSGSAVPVQAEAPENASAFLVRNQPQMPPAGTTSFRDIVQDVLPSVVQIDVVNIVNQPNPWSRSPNGPSNRFPDETPNAPPDNSPFEYFFGPQRGRPDQGNREFRQQGMGSGVIVRKEGTRAYVLSNAHVVGEADEIKIRLTDGREFDGRLVGQDTRKDLALVVFETSEAVPVAELGDSDTLYPGDWVLAMGNPLGFESTVTAGIVSAIGRETLPGSSVTGFTDYIQTDAAINQGNSGGALVDLDGKIVGINTWIASPTGGSIGLGFAIPVNNAKRAIGDFITKGHVDYGWLGVSVGNASPAMADAMNLKERGGAFVYGVFGGSPGDRAGLHPGDFITHIDGKAIKDSNQLVRIIGNFAPGEVTRFDLVRGDETLSLEVRLESRASEQKIAEISRKIWPGISVAPMSDEVRRGLNLSDADGDVVIVTVEPESAAHVAGLAAGDVIEKINDQKLSSVADFYRIVNERKGKDLIFTIERKGTRIILGLIS